MAATTSATAQGNNDCCSLQATQQQIFDKIAKNDVDGLRQVTAQFKGNINFVDDNGMTPLQHAACKGNKLAVQLLLDMGADINFNKHGASYTPLHFAALSGNTEVCRLLLDAGINASSLNSVSRTASQMAAFVGNHACVETINSYVARAQLEPYTHPQEPLIPPALLEAFHAFVVETSLHPVRITLNLQTLGLLKHLTGLTKALALMSESEMKKSSGANEVLSFKFHYLHFLILELQRCEEQCKAQRNQKKSSTEAETSKHDFVEMFIKRVLKENKQGQLDYVQYLVSECARDFPFRECSIFRQIVAQLADKEAPPALTVLRNCINGHRGFADEGGYCSTCGNEKPDKKCSKCKAVQYCDRECQRLHWFMHKKMCARLTASSGSSNSAEKSRRNIDAAELSQVLQTNLSINSHNAAT